jgi:hypothetical protein
MLDSVLEAAIFLSRQHIDPMDVLFRHIYVRKYTTEKPDTFRVHASLRPGPDDSEFPHAELKC